MTSELEEKMKKMADFKLLLITSIITAMGFVVGLFWNDALRETINQIVPQGEALYVKYVAAITVTIVVAIVSYLLYRSQQINLQKLQKAIDVEKNRQIESLKKLKMKKKDFEKVKREIIEGSK